MNKEDLLLEQWKMASELHRHEDEHSWQRFQYYITLTGILVSALGVVWTTISISPVNTKVAICIISAFGAVTSLVSALIFKRSFMYHLYRIAVLPQGGDQGVDFAVVSMDKKDCAFRLFR